MPPHHLKNRHYDLAFTVQHFSINEKPDITPCLSIESALYTTKWKLNLNPALCLALVTGLRPSAAGDSHPLASLGQAHQGFLAIQD
jgi:hypothetical protein